MCVSLYTPKLIGIFIQIRWTLPLSVRVPYPYIFQQLFTIYKLYRVAQNEPYIVYAYSTVYRMLLCTVSYSWFSKLFFVCNFKFHKGFSLGLTQYLHRNWLLSLPFLQIQSKMCGFSFFYLFLFFSPSTNFHCLAIFPNPKRSVFQVARMYGNWCTKIRWLEEIARSKTALHSKKHTEKVEEIFRCENFLSRLYMLKFTRQLKCALSKAISG